MFWAVFSWETGVCTTYLNTRFSASWRPYPRWPWPQSGTWRWLQTPRISSLSNSCGMSEKPSSQHTGHQGSAAGIQRTPSQVLWTHLRWGGCTQQQAVCSTLCPVKSHNQYKNWVTEASELLEEKPAEQDKSPEREQQRTKETSEFSPFIFFLPLSYSSRGA